MCNQSKCKCKAEPGLLEKKSEPHVHTASMKLYAEDAAETDKPWERWEVRVIGHTHWDQCVASPQWDPHTSYRRKRKMRAINGFYVPAPETEDPGVGTSVFIPDPTQEVWHTYSPWYGASYDRRVLARGLIFLNKDEAIANAKAMCGIDPSK